MAQPQFNLWLHELDFKKDTGLNAKENLQLYISYSQLRQGEGLRQSLTVVANHIVSVMRELGSKPQ